MTFVERVKAMTIEQAASMMLAISSNGGADALIRLGALASRFIQGQSSNAAVTAVISSLREGNAGQVARVFRRLMQEISPHCREKLVRSLLVNGVLRSPALRKEFEREEGFPPPFTVLISPTTQCNLKCTGCYAGSHKRDTGLSVEVLDRILAEARAIGCLFVAFSGGEPLTRKEDLLGLMKKYEDMYFMFFTNGTLIESEVADELQRVGNAAAIFSLEGFSAATNSRRGKGVFETVVRSMDLLKEKGVPFGTSVTVTSSNIEEVTGDDFIGELVRKGVVIVWYFLFMPTGQDPDLSLMPSPEQREYLRQRGMALRRDHPFFVADLWNDAPYLGGCIAAGRICLHINANGDVEPCVFSHFAVDNIKHKTLVEALRSDFFRAIRSWQPSSGNLLTPCMIIDHPKVYRDFVISAGAYPTNDGAQNLLMRLTELLADYSRGISALEDPIWQREKARYGCRD